jgi:hypothetical protein
MCCQRDPAWARNERGGMTLVVDAVRDRQVVDAVRDRQVVDAKFSTRELHFCRRTKGIVNHAVFDIEENFGEKQQQILCETFIGIYG